MSDREILWLQLMGLNETRMILERRTCRNLYTTLSYKPLMHCYRFEKMWETYK